MYTELFSEIKYHWSLATKFHSLPITIRLVDSHAAFQWALKLHLNTVYSFNLLTDILQCTADMFYGH